MTLIFIFPKIQSYISNKLASPACYMKALLCGRMIKPPALKLRSTGADEARTHKTWFATLKRAEYSSDFSFQNSKIFEGNTESLLKLLASIFLAVPLVLDCVIGCFSLAVVDIQS